MYKLLACLLLARVAPAQIAPAGDVVGVGNFIHVVSNLDQSVAFYHDVLGLDLQRTAQAQAGPRPFLSAPEVPRLYNAVGAQYRVLSAQVPESPMRAELVEFKDVDRKPVRPRVQDPGASILVLTVRDLTPVLARLKNSATPVWTRGSVPVHMGEGVQAVLVSDPDGFFVELVERNPTPATKAPAESNFIDVSFTFVVSDTKRIAQVFHDALGFELHTGAFEADKSLEQLMNVRSEVRRTTTTVPGTSFPIEFLEFKGKHRQAVHSRLQDPGSGVLRLVVRDVDGMVKKLSATGVAVASAGGEIITLPGGGNSTLRAAITSAPDNLFLQALQTPK